jgi:4-carboxymuconolactone decarboxylase
MSTAWRDVGERMEEVTAPQRLDPLCDVTIPPRGGDAIRRLGQLHGQPPPLKLDGFYGIIGRSPDVVASYLQLGADLMVETTLPARTRELATLRTGWLCGAPYQWGEHVRSGKTAGLTTSDIVRVREGAAADGWGPADRALLVAVDELHDRSTLSDATWAALAEHLDERQIVELLFLVGHYHLTAYVQNALRIPLNPGNTGLGAE